MSVSPPGKVLPAPAATTAAGTAGRSSHGPCAVVANLNGEQGKYSLRGGTVTDCAGHGGISLRHGTQRAKRVVALAAVVFVDGHVAPLPVGKIVVRFYLSG